MSDKVSPYRRSPPKSEHTAMLLVEKGNNMPSSRTTSSVGTGEVRKAMFGNNKPKCDYY